jgi:hypothetical protein
MFHQQRLDKVRSVALTVFAAAVLALGLVACQSERSGSAPPLNLHKVESDPHEVTLSKIGQAESLESVGDYRSALEMLRQALARAASTDLRHRIQEMRLRLKRRALSQVLEARVVMPRDRVVADEPAEVVLELTNHGSVPITIPRADYRRYLLLFWKEVGHSVIELRCKLDLFDPLGSERSEVFSRFVEPDEDIVVPPGGTWVYRPPLDLAAVRPETTFTSRLSPACLRRLRVEGIIRPVRLKVGEKDFFTTVHLEPAVLYLLPRGAEVMLENPLRHLELALRRAPGEPRFLPHVLVASSMLEGEDRERARLALVRCREQGPAVLRPSVERALDLFFVEKKAPPPTKAPEVTFKR